MKLLAILISLTLGSATYAQSNVNPPEVLSSLHCKVSLGFYKNAAVREMQITILKPDESSPYYPTAEVTLLLSSQSTEKLPVATVGQVYAQPPFSQFAMGAYLLSWKDDSQSELNLICLENGTCSGSGTLQGNSQKVITCLDVSEK